MTRLVAFFAACLLPLWLSAGPARSEETSLEVPMRALLEEFRDRYAFPGATAAVTFADGRRAAVAVGLSDVEAGRPMTPETPMLAASIGKTIWGALVLALESDGVLSRSDLVAAHLGHMPWFDRLPNAGTMTVAHLLTHSAGLPDHVHMDGVADALISLGDAAEFGPAAAIAFILDTPPLFAAGDGWAYTDTGYLLLGLVIEAAAGRDVFELAAERVLLPLNLSQTVPSTSPTIPNLAVGYTSEPNPFGLPPRTADAAGELLWNPAVEWTGGGFAATSADLADWGDALFTGRAIAAPYLERLLEGVAVHPDAPGILYGAGVAIYEDTPHGRVLGHGGWIPGYVSSLRHYADHGVTIAFQVNTDIGTVDDSTDLVPALEAALADLLLAEG